MIRVIVGKLNFIFFSINFSFAFLFKRFQISISVQRSQRFRISMISVLMIVISLLNPTNSQEIQLEKKSVINFGWGMMFDYYGQMLHGLNKYNLIVGVKVPTVSDLNLQIPYMLQPSVSKNFPKNIAYQYVTNTPSL